MIDKNEHLLEKINVIYHCESSNNFKIRYGKFVLGKGNMRLKGSMLKYKVYLQRLEVRISLLFSHFYWSSSSKNILILII